MDVRVGPWRRLNTEELMLSNCGVGEVFESPLDCKEIKPVIPKGNQLWKFIGRTDAKLSSNTLATDVKIWLIGRDPDAGKDWRKKGTTEGEMVGWHHWLNGHEFEQNLGDGEGEGSLAYCSPWGCKELDMTERLNNIPFCRSRNILFRATLQQPVILGFLGLLVSDTFPDLPTSVLDCHLPAPPVIVF